MERKDKEIRRLLGDMFQAAVDRALPDKFLPSHIAGLRPCAGKTLVLAAGKSGAAMARTFEKNYRGDFTGFAVCAYDHAVTCEKFEVLEAAHPVADENSVIAARRMLEEAGKLNAGDRLIFLMSGGASALLASPPAGMSLGEKQAVSKALLKSGGNIQEMNCLRRHMSMIKGGRLAAAAYPAEVITWAISDVPGDEPRDIGSGPTIHDPSTCADALNVAREYGISLPLMLEKGLRDGSLESVKPGDKRLEKISFEIVACQDESMNAAMDFCRDNNLPAEYYGTVFKEDSLSFGIKLAEVARKAKSDGKAPLVIISGGETSVKVRGNGTGGRNSEFVLSLAVALKGEKGIYAIAGDTDGVDGLAPIAGALITPDTLTRARKQGLDPDASLQNNDAHTFFKALGDSVITGPTLTNVNDFRAILIL